MACVASTAVAYLLQLPALEIDIYVLTPRIVAAHLIVALCGYYDNTDYCFTTLFELFSIPEHLMLLFRIQETKKLLEYAF